VSQALSNSREDPETEIANVGKSIETMCDS
jgi:hypothetical protein